MTPPSPPGFTTIADSQTQRAFLGGRPEVVAWLGPGTKLFKWTKTIVSSRGISPWWQFLESRTLATGGFCPGIQELQEYASRLGVHDRDYARVRVAVTEEWNKMTNPVAIELLNGAWGYIGKAAGQLKTSRDPKVFFIGGEYQVWVPGLTANDIRRISLLPYLKPNSPFGAR
ncbi:MAG TPA: hypothetical protein VKU19_36165 [Bryobacteraceae bacterium]|nr:hypothetical protein [Bryobacteraceae bacterium]